MNANTYYLNILYHRGNICNNLAQYLKADNGSGYLRCLKLCYRQNAFVNNIKAYPLYPTEFKTTICGLLDLENLSTEKIVAFISALSSLEKDKINSFLLRKKEFEHNVLVKNYDSASKVLKQVREQFGISLWLIDCVSILYSLNQEVVDSEQEFDDLKNNSYFSIFALKNRVSVRHDYYLKQMETLFRNVRIGKKFETFLKYVLAISVPKTDFEWKDIFAFSLDLSLIDMYLCTADFLNEVFTTQNQIKPLYQICKEYLYDINDFTINIPNKQDDDLGKEYIKSFNESKYSTVINNFYSIDNTNYDSISLYILTSISYLLIGEHPESSESVIYCMIVELMFTVLKRNEQEAINAIYRLAAIARLLRTFAFHKGISVFLRLVANFDLGYDIEQLYSTSIDNTFKSYIDNSNNLSIMPFASKIKNYDYDIISNYLKQYNSQNIPGYNEISQIYFKECFVSLCLERLYNANIEKATNLLVNSFIENKLLVYTVEVKPIIEYISKKYKDKKHLSLDEICYVFIDSNMEGIMDDCFLDLFDEFFEQYPIDIINQINTNDEIKYYFLYEICKIKRLTTIYLLFSSTEEAEKYRIRILEHLIEQQAYEKKILMDEIEDITKRRMLRKKLKRINECKLIINEDSLRKSCFDIINEQVDLFNNTIPVMIRIESENQPDQFVKLIDRQVDILKNIYGIYCKEFCFGNSGLDISLSTRVRHGTLTNQVLKAFSDNDMVVNGHGKNDFFNKYILSGELDNNVTDLLSRFNSSINKILDYFVKNTLKVFVDTPIEGAVFDYRYDLTDILRLFEIVIVKQRISADEAIEILNNYLIEKTNEYLAFIRREKIKELENNLINELDGLINSIKNYCDDTNTQKDIERKIITCKTDVQTELKRIANWFVLSDYNDWESFSFGELIETCAEIDKNLFTGFEMVDVSVNDDVKIKIKGNYFAELVDIVLIIFNNAIVHSNYMNNLKKLTINCDFKEDTNSFYLLFSNNIDESINVAKLDDTIERINLDYENKKYRELNVRQEGGMGLYKIMHIMDSNNQLNRMFYINSNENIFRIELHFSKVISE